MLRSLASWSFRHRWLAFLAWLAVSIAVAVAGGAFAGPVASGSVDASDAGQAYALLEEGFGSSGSETAQLVVADPAGVDRHDTAIAEAATTLRAAPGILSVTTAADSPALTSPDGAATMLMVDMAVDDQDDVAPATLDALTGARDQLRTDGAQAEIASWWFAGGEIPASELFGLIAAVIILLVAFGSVVAMGLPLLTAILGVAAALGLLGLWANVVPTPEFAGQVAAMIGLGVGIDYALLIVTRYRAELARGVDFHDAAVEAIATAGRAVVLAGATVMVSLLGMMLVGLDIMQGVGITAATAVVVAVVAAITLLPALLAIVGHRIDALSLHRRRRPPTAPANGLWYRWSRTVQRYPRVAAAAGVILLLTLAAPVTVMRLASSDMGNEAPGTTTREAYDLIARHFGPGANGPLVVAIASGQPGRTEALVAEITTFAGVETVMSVATAPNGTTAVTLLPTTGPQDAATTDLVHRLRDQVIPASGLDAHVGGSTALDVDFSDLMADRLPWFMFAVLSASFVLLMVEFRSLLVPLKAVILNLLSIAAAYGVLVVVFQWGWFGLASPGPIEPWAPMLLFAIVFGLSMDYEVFLLTAIKERFDRTGQASGSVADGLAGTARVITAAAAIMICVFGSFVVSELRPLRLFGVGTAAAVLIDATVVRLVLVPATMELLGSRNWWAPRWLARLLPGHAPVGVATTPVPGTAPVEVSA